MSSNANIFAAVICCGFFLTAQAQDSVVTSVFGSGVARATVGPYSNTGTLGQAGLGVTQIAGLVSAGGFWNQYAKSTGPVSLPTKALIYYSRTGSTFPGTIWVTSGDGRIDSQIAIGSEPRLSHNGRYIICHGGGEAQYGNRSMYLIDLQTHSSRLFFQNSYDWIIGYCWSKDDSIIIHDYSTSMHWTKREGGDNGVWFSYSWYDDGPYLKPGTWTVACHNAYTGIMIADSAGANYRAIPNTVGGYWPAWSPDGQWIAYVVAVGDSLKNYYKVRPDGTDKTTLTSFADSEATFFNGGVWMPDGSKLLVAARVHGVQGMYALAIDGSGHMDLMPTKPGEPITFVGSVAGGPGPVVTDVRDVPLRPGASIASEYRLEESYPNPFNPSTTISFSLPTPSKVELTVYNVLGEQIAKLVDDVEAPGFKNVRWDATGVASGTYFYKLQAVSTSDAGRSFTMVRKMLLIR